jgi:hypothetical protein
LAPLLKLVGGLPLFTKLPRRRVFAETPAAPVRCRRLVGHEGVDNTDEGCGDTLLVRGLYIWEALWNR